MADNNVIHELAMLYLQKKDTSNLTPAQFLDEYNKVKQEIKEHNATGKKQQWTV